MEFLIGALGAILIIALFAAGVLLGWKLKAADVKRSKYETDPLTEQEARRLKDEQEAFSMIQNYNVEDAYGMNRDFRLHGAHSDGNN